MRILLVDDSNAMRRIQTTQLGQIGITDIVEASNGQDGLDKLADNMPIDFILLDWNMPVMDGLAMLKAVREKPMYNDVKVIMCTSESEKKKVIEALKEGANNYVVKPFASDTLKEKLGI